MTENTKSKNNKGFLYPNTNKTKATQPDYTGKVVIEVNGSVVERKIVAWENNDSKGQRYLAVSISELVNIENNNNSNSNNANTNTSNTGVQNASIQRVPVSSPISDDLEDLDAILRIADDDNPFNT